MYQVHVETWEDIFYGQPGLAPIVDEFFGDVHEFTFSDGVKAYESMRDSGDYSHVQLVSEEGTVVYDSKSG